MERLRFLLPFFIASSSLAAQSVEVWIDLWTDSVFYKKGAKTVEKPRFRPGQEVEIRLVELNPFAREARVEAREVPETEAEKAGGAANFSALTSAFLPTKGLGGGIFQSLFSTDSAAAGGGIFSFINLPEIKMGGESIALESFFKGSRGASELVAEAETAVEEAAAAIEIFRKNCLEMRQIERAATVSRLAAAEAENLLTRSDLRPSTVKRLAEEQYRLIFRAVPGAAPSIEDLLDWQNLPAEMRSKWAEIQRGQRDFSEKTKHLDGLARQLGDLEAGDDAAFSGFQKKLRTAQKQAKQTDSEWQKLLARGDAAFSKNDLLPSVEKMAGLQLRLASARETPFEHRSKIRLADGATDLFVEVFDKKSGSDSASKKTVKTRSLRLETSGGLRVRAGGGLFFGQFAEPSQSFSARGGKIVADAGEGLSPTAATTVLFYAESRGGRVAFGGSLGVGVPLSGDQNLRFLVGPALLIGQKSRIAFSAGAMIGQVERLARGFAVGDVFDPSLGDIPTRRRYEMGWFAGVSMGIR